MGPGHRATSNRCPSSVLWGLVHSIRVALPLVGWRLETGLMGKAMQWWKHNLRTGGCNVGLICTLLLLLLCGLMVEGWHCRRLASLIFLPKYREKYTYLSGNWTDVELKKRWNFVFCLSWACCLDVVLAPATAAAEQAARVSMFLSWVLAADWVILIFEISLKYIILQSFASIGRVDLVVYKGLQVHLSTNTVGCWDSILVRSIRQWDRALL